MRELPWLKFFAWELRWITFALALLSVIVTYFGQEMAWAN